MRLGRETLPSLQNLIKTMCYFYLMCDKIGKSGF